MSEKERLIKELIETARREVYKSEGGSHQDRIVRNAENLKKVLDRYVRD